MVVEPLRSVTPRGPTRVPWLVIVLPLRVDFGRADGGLAVGIGRHVLAEPRVAALGGRALLGDRLPIRAGDRFVASGRVAVPGRGHLLGGFLAIRSGDGLVARRRIAVSGGGAAQGADFAVRSSDRAGVGGGIAIPDGGVIQRFWSCRSAGCAYRCGWSYCRISSSRLSRWKSCRLAR